MVFTKWQIKHTPLVNNEWSSVDETTLEGYYDPIMRVGIGDKKDSFSFKVTNFNGNYNSFFNVKDRYEVSRVTNSYTFTSDDILMVAASKDIPLERSGVQNMIKPTNYNFSETVAEAIVFADLKGRTIDEALQEVLESAALKNPNFGVTWNSNNPTTKSDGITPLPTIDSADDRFFNQPLSKIFEKYSTQQATEDTTYYWYVDNNNTFVWRPRTSTINYEFDASTDSYINIKEGKDLSAVKNFIIIKGGKDPANKQIQTKYVNWSSVQSVGVKYYFLISKTNDAEELVMADLHEDYGADIGENNYPIFPYTSSWKSKATEGTVTAANEDEYVAVIRSHIKAALKEEAESFAKSVQYGKLTVDVAFVAGTREWGLGDNIKVTIPSIRENPFVLRVEEIQYSTEVDTFTLVEDEGTIGKKE